MALSLSLSLSLARSARRSAQVLCFVLYMLCSASTASAAMHCCSMAHCNNYYLLSLISPKRISISLYKALALCSHKCIDI